MSILVKFEAAIEDLEFRIADKQFQIDFISRSQGRRSPRKQFRAQRDIQRYHKELTKMQVELAELKNS